MRQSAPRTNRPRRESPDAIRKLLLVAGFVAFLITRVVAADVLIVADEFPAMQVVADSLKSSKQINSQLIEQSKLPTSLTSFQAVVVYIHRGLDAAAERAFIQYAKDGGRLVLLHHSISSGKRQNKDWFKVLGVELPTGEVAQGGYKWIEGVTGEWVQLNSHPIMTNQVNYPQQIAYSNPTLRTLPGFKLSDTEVYLNHVLTGPRTILMGMKYSDPTGKTWMQDTAGWLRSAGKGWVVYFMPGHSLHDFENPTYRQIVLNAITQKLD